MDWERNSADWPMAAHSRFILHKPHLWHIQDAGNGPMILLIHGAGGATQSWRHLFPLLTKDYRVIAIDLPGQGFTKLGAQQRCGLTEMAEDLIALCRSENWSPEIVVGHSAGAAIALQMARDAPDLVRHIIGVNAALDNFKGLAGVVFPIMAKTLAMLPMVADVFSATTSKGNSIQKLINGTGSNLETTDLEYYKRLFANRQHVDATLQMMSQWKLDPLVSDMPVINARTHLLAGSNDKMVPADVSKKSAAKLLNGTFELLESLGHLAHEEAPQIIKSAIEEFTAVNMGKQ